MTISNETENCDEPDLWDLGRSALSGMIKLVLFLVIQGLAILLVGIVALFVSFEPAWSAEGPVPALVKPSDARSGSLLLKTDDGYAEATRLGIDVDLTVSGPTVRARITQIFKNPTQNWVEATYVYPLPSAGLMAMHREYELLAGRQQLECGLSNLD